MLEIGDRVRLPANPEEGWAEEYGIILDIGSDGTIIVQVELPFREKNDDGFREVPEDYVEVV